MEPVFILTIVLSIVITLLPEPLGTRPSLTPNSTTPISPPTRENRFTEVRFSLRVGGLLPIVSKDSNGLVSRSNYQSFPENHSISGNKYAKIIQHSTMGAWNATFIDIFAVRGLGGNPGRIIVAISSDGSYTKNISIVKSGNPDIRVYTDSQFIYLKNTYVYGENISITSTTNFPIIFENMSEEPSGLTEIV